MTTLRLTCADRLELRDPMPIEECEVLQVPSRVTIVNVEPELIELVRLRERRIQPDGAGFSLAKLRPRSCHDQRHHNAMCLAAADTANQIHARDDVAPL